MKSKISLLLNALDKETLRQIKAELKPFLPEADWARVLLYLIKWQAKPQQRLRMPDPKIIHRNVFGDTLFNGPKLTKKIFEAHQHLKQMLIVHSIKQEPELGELLLARAYYKRNLSDQAQTLQAKNQKRKPSSKSQWHLLQDFCWTHLAYYEDASPKMTLDAQMLIQATDQLTVFFVTSKLKLTCELLFREKLKTESHVLPFTSMIETYCQDHEASLPLLTQGYWLAYQMAKTQTEDSFIALEKYFYQQQKGINSPDQLILLTYLINFTSLKIRTNDKAYFYRAFQLYEYGYQENIFVINQRFITGHFLNLVYLSCYLKKIDWIEDLLNRWQQNIEAWLDAATFEIGMARLSFAKKAYDQTLTYLNQLQYKNSQYKVREQLLRIATHFEKKEWKVVDSLCISFNKYLKMHFDDHNQNAIAGKQFIFIVRQLMKPRASMDKIQELINRAQYIVFQEWLEEQLRELSKTK